MFQGRRAQTNNGWEGYGPWDYTIISEEDLNFHLERLAFHHVRGSTDCVTFQPFPALDGNQDRYDVQDWDLSNGRWKFWAVFDGHAGDETVQYTVASLPGRIKKSLDAELDKSEGTLSPSTVEELLKQVIVSFDEDITNDFLALFPKGIVHIPEMSDDDIRTCIFVDGKLNPKVARTMAGTTALIALLDPTRRLYIASLGDCRAVLGTKEGSGAWVPQVLSFNHNGSDTMEQDRIKKEHPGEDGCVLNNRVCGWIAVTRAIGDHIFKLPLAASSKVYLLSDPPAKLVSKLPELQSRMLTPPYLSNVPEVKHVDLSDRKLEDNVLILCSDGLIDLYQAHESDEHAIKRWVEVVGPAGMDKPTLRLLRDGMGHDLEKASFYITAEMDIPWLDDVTVLVTKL